MCSVFYITEIKLCQNGLSLLINRLILYCNLTAQLLAIVALLWATIEQTQYYKSLID